MLSMHKPFELVFLICLGWQTFAQAEYDMRAYHHNTDCSLMSTLPLHTKTQLWYYLLIIPHCHLHTNSNMEIIRLLGYVVQSDDLLLSRHPAPSVFVFNVITVNFLWGTPELFYSARSVYHPTACKWLQDSLDIASHKPDLCLFTVDLALMARH